MTEDRRHDLTALLPDDDARDRVVGAVMSEIRSPASSSWLASTLESSGRLVRPVLAAAALVGLLLVFPGRSRHPDVVAAEVLLGQALDVSDTWLRWSMRSDTPDPRALLILYSDEPKP